MSAEDAGGQGRARALARHGLEPAGGYRRDDTCRREERTAVNRPLLGRVEKSVDLARWAYVSGERPFLFLSLRVLMPVLLLVLLLGVQGRRMRHMIL